MPSSRPLLIAYACPLAISFWDCTRIHTLSEVESVGFCGRQHPGASTEQQGLYRCGKCPIRQLEGAILVYRFL